MQTIGIIPARYASTRFPGKPLTMIGGKSMIQRVYEQVCAATTLQKVVVATDDFRIAQHIQSFGGAVVMTSEQHRTGTDRCAEVAHRIEFRDFDAVVNIQGDEPFIQPEQIDALVNTLLLHENFKIVTLVKKIEANDTLFDENVVKVVFDKHQRAIYFSRHPLPFVRGVSLNEWLSKTDFYKHIGMYAFRAETLREIARLDPTRLEIAESLEQLRWLEKGYSVGVALTQIETIGIDTPQDLAKVQHFL